MRGAACRGARACDPGQAQRLGFLVPRQPHPVDAGVGAGDRLEIAPATGGPTGFSPFTRAKTPELHLSDGWFLAIRPDEVGEFEPD